MWLQLQRTADKLRAMFRQNNPVLEEHPKAKAPATEEAKDAKRRPGGAETKAAVDVGGGSNMQKVGREGEDAALPPALQAFARVLRRVGSDTGWAEYEGELNSVGQWHGYDAVALTRCAEPCPDCTHLPLPAHPTLAWFR